MTRFAIVIPARLESSRIPGKVMKKINGMTMIEQVIKRVNICVDARNIFVATDNIEIKSHVESLGIQSIMTSRNHTNGTNRVAEAVQTLNHEYIVIVQADEILLLPEHLEKLINEINNTPKRKIYNVVSKLKPADLEDSSVVKSLIAPNNQIIYLCRKNPLLSNTSKNNKIIKKNTGVYAYPRIQLLKIAKLKDSPIQELESIEQLKLIENLIPLFSVEVPESYPSINEPKDLENYYEIISSDEKQQHILKLIK